MFKEVLWILIDHSTLIDHSVTKIKMYRAHIVLVTHEF